MPELHKSDKRRFGFVFVKFHLLPPHLSRGFIIRLLAVHNTDANISFI